MSIPTKIPAYTQGFGTSSIDVPVIQVTKVPTTFDNNYKLGQPWIVTSTNSIYYLTSVTTSAGITSATWTLAASGSSIIATLTGDSGGALSPTAGNFNLLGTANQITTTGSGSTITWSIPSAFIAPGSIASTTTITSGTALVATTTMTAGTGITATTGNIVASTGNINATLGSMSAGTSVTAGTSLTATLGNITATNGNLVLTAAGNKMIRTSVATTTTAGANSTGTVTLVGGTATVSTTSVATGSQVRIWRQSVGATGAAALGELSVGTIVNGSSFVINAWSPTDATSLQATDVSVIGWDIVN